MGFSESPMVSSLWTTVGGGSAPNCAFRLLTSISSRSFHAACLSSVALSWRYINFISSIVSSSSSRSLLFLPVAGAEGGAAIDSFAISECFGERADNTADIIHLVECR